MGRNSRIRSIRSEGQSARGEEGRSTGVAIVRAAAHGAGQVFEDVGRSALEQTVSVEEHHLQGTAAGSTAPSGRWPSANLRERLHRVSLMLRARSF